MQVISPHLQLEFIHGGVFDMPRGPSLGAARWAGRHHTPRFAGLARRRRIISRSVPGGPTETQPPRVRVQQQRPPKGAGGSRTDDVEQQLSNRGARDGRSGVIMSGGRCAAGEKSLTQVGIGSEQRG